MSQCGRGRSTSTQPAAPLQRRYEALRCYFVEEAPAAEVGDRFGYSPSYRAPARRRVARRAHRVLPLLQARPRRARASPSTIRDRVLALRAQDRSVTEIAAALTAEGTPASAQTVWAILHAEGIERLGRRRAGGPAPRTEPVKARALASGRPATWLRCDHAGLYLLLPAMVELGFDALVAAARYPGTKVLSVVPLAGVARCCSSAPGADAPPTPSRSGPTPASGLLLGLVALPKATHLTSYSYRVERSSNVALLEALARAARRSASTRARPGSTWTSTPSATTARRSRSRSTTCRPARQRTRSVLTFFAQDHASTEMVYANADLTKAEQAGEVLAFAEYWQRVSGQRPGAVVLRLPAHHLRHPRRTRAPGASPS